MRIKKSDVEKNKNTTGHGGGGWSESGRNIQADLKERHTAALVDPQICIF